MNFIISDLHLGHHKIAPLRGFTTTEEHDQELINRWNSVVKANDKVYVAGDVFFRKETAHKLNYLNGRKFLIMGNHDQYLKASDYEKFFERAYGVFIYENCVITHIPVHPSQFERFSLNIHGHLHEKSIGDLRYVNVSAETVNLTPISLDNLIESRIGKIALDYINQQINDKTGLYGPKP